MMQYLVMTLFLLAACLSGAASPEGVIRGKVFEQATGKELPGVNVIYKSSRGTVTDAGGFFMIRLPAGMTILTFL